MAGRCRPACPIPTGHYSGRVTTASPPESLAALDSNQRRRRRVSAWSGLGVAMALFAALAPALGWLELSNGIEQLHAATVLEIRRTGNWLVPTLNGRERINKPPLPAWMSAAAVTDRTMELVSSLSRADRDVGFARLAWETRWPIALAGCLMLVAVFDLGATLASRRVGLAAAIVAGTSLLFLRYVRLGSTDVPLALWVATANAMLARALFRRQLWLGIVGAGAALGLAFMCKGPVALLQTLVPLGVWAGVDWRGRRSRSPADASQLDGPPLGRHSMLLPVLASIALFLAIILPWPLTVLQNRPEAVRLWKAEITREGATDHEYGPIYSYLSLIPNLLPWLPAIGVGLFLSLRSSERTARRNAQCHRRYMLPFYWLVVPIIVMSLFRDKHERYLLPLLPAAAIFGGRGLVMLVSKPSRWLGLQLALIAAAAIALPILGLMPSVVGRSDGSALFGSALGVMALLLALAATAAMFLLRVRKPVVSLGVSVMTLLAVNALALWGYAHTAAGQSEMRPIAERILDRDPRAVVGYCDPRKDPKPMPPDIAIFLNRAVEQVDSDFLTRRTDRPADVLVMLQRENEPPPAPPGWKSFAAEPYGKRFWHALSRQ